MLAEVGVGVGAYEWYAWQGAEFLVSVYALSFVVYGGGFVVDCVGAGGAWIGGGEEDVGVGTFDAYVPNKATREASRRRKNIFEVGAVEVEHKWRRHPRRLRSSW